MSGKRISDMNPSAPLDGSEALPVVQSGENVRASAQSIADLADGVKEGDPRLTDERTPKIHGNEAHSETYATNIVKVTQAEYDAIDPLDPDLFYVVTG